VVVPYLVHLGQDIRALHIACGSEHSLIVDIRGVVYSCGSNTCGQLGTGSEDDCSEFKPVPYFTQFELIPIEIAFVACGEEFR
jgi:alpha-tubulin suppressor-like RCC1 family protein